MNHLEEGRRILLTSERKGRHGVCRLEDVEERPRGAVIEVIVKLLVKGDGVAVGQVHHADELPARACVVDKHGSASGVMLPALARGKIQARGTSGEDLERMT